MKHNHRFGLSTITEQILGIWPTPFDHVSYYCTYQILGRSTSHWMRARAAGECYMNVETYHCAPCPVNTSTTSPVPLELFV